MAAFRAIQVSKPNGPFELVTRNVSEPGAQHVRVRVEACGICHSDSLTVQGLFPGIEYPRVPGHEVIGRIDAVGSGVIGWNIGDRVGVGWFGGNCGRCGPCRRGDLVQCQNPLIPGVTHDGGYAEMMIADRSGLVRIPDDFAAVDAAPLVCAGVTTFNGLRNSGARPGDLVAIIGIGGLGHLAVQFAAHMGFNVAAIGRGRDKEALARSLGAAHYINSAAEDVSTALKNLGGAALVLATVPDAAAMTTAIDGLGVGGVLVAAGVSIDAIHVSPMQLIAGDHTLKGTAVGTAADSEDTVRFAAAQNVRPMTEVLPLERAAEGYERMMSGAARFRVVLTMPR